MIGMKILVISDTHNDIENLMNYIDKVSLLDFDVIAFPGDITDVGRGPRGFEGSDITKVILEELKGLKKPILSLPGNQDLDIIPILEEQGVSLHGKGRVINDVGFYGFGGARTPFDTPLEPSEDEIKSGLERGYEEVKNCEAKVQVTHMPPAGTKLDVISSGAHVGSEVVRKFILEKKPAIAISAHIHEARGTDELNGTKLINSGRFPEGYCGLVNIKPKGVETKVINLI